MINWGEWLPDQSPLGLRGLVKCVNLWPKNATDYGPFPTIQEHAVTPNTLSSAVRGAFCFRANDGTRYDFAGDLTTLYMLDDLGGSWTTVTGTAYSLSTTDEFWDFTNWQDIALATQRAASGTGGIQKMDVAATISTFTTLTGAPVARYISIWRPQALVAGNVYESGDFPNRVHWSEQGNYASWPTVGTDAAAAAQSGSYDLPSGGPIRAVLKGVGGWDGIIICERATWGVRYAGPPQVYDFILIDAETGTAAPKSIVEVGDLIYFYSNRGFVVCDGSSVRPFAVGKIENWFSNRNIAQLQGNDDGLDLPHLNFMVGAVYKRHNIIVWLYPHAVGTGNRTLRGVLVYNYAHDRWSTGDVDSLVRNSVNATLTTTAWFEYAWTRYSNATGPSDTDDLGFFGQNHQSLKLQSHLTLSTTGLLAAPYEVETGEIHVDGRRLFVNGVELYDEGIQDQTRTVRLGYRERLSSSLSTYVTGTGASANEADYTYRYRFRKSSRFFRLNVQATPKLNYFSTSIKGYRLLGTPEGERDSVIGEA